MEATPATILAEIRTMIAISREGPTSNEGLALAQGLERLTDLVETLVPTERKVPA